MTDLPASSNYYFKTVAPVTVIKISKVPYVPADSWSLRWVRNNVSLEVQRARKLTAVLDALSNVQSFYVTSFAIKKDRFYRAVPILEEAGLIRCVQNIDYERYIIVAPPVPEGVTLEEITLYLKSAMDDAEHSILNTTSDESTDVDKLWTIYHYFCDLFGYKISPKQKTAINFRRLLVDNSYPSIAGLLTYFLNNQRQYADSPNFKWFGKEARDLSYTFASNLAIISRDAAEARSMYKGRDDWYRRHLERAGIDYLVPRTDLDVIEKEKQRLAEREEARRKSDEEWERKLAAEADASYDEAIELKEAKKGATAVHMKSAIQRLRERQRSTRHMRGRGSSE